MMGSVVGVGLKLLLLVSLAFELKTFVEAAGQRRFGVAAISMPMKAIANVVIILVGSRSGRRSCDAIDIVAVDVDVDVNLSIVVVAIINQVDFVADADAIVNHRRPHVTLLT